MKKSISSIISFLKEVFKEWYPTFKRSGKNIEIGIKKEKKF